MKEEPKQIEVMQEEIESEVKEKQIHDISIGEEPKQEVDGYMTIGEDVGQEGYSGNIGRNASQETAKIQQGIDNDNPVSEKEGEATKMEPKRRESDLEFEKESIGDTSIQPLEPSSNFTATDAPQVETPEKTPAIPKVDKTVQTSSTSSNSCASEATPDAPQIETSEKTPATSSNSSFLLSNPEPNTSVISKIDKAVQTSSKSSDSSNEPNISVIALAGQIKTIAVFYKLESLQNNACLAMEKMKRVKEFGQEKKLSAKKFSILVHSMLISFEENRMRKTKSSICLESILKQLLQFLIRPLGTHIVHEAIELVAQKLREYENDDDGILPNVISENLNYLLMATGFYNQLE
ncbi:hypothetical protein B9Z55_021131 [Caenorhabditis nigoni]|nr:hypothetical protein B9Z55_021131 [Caenorhabditis nigoni]